MKTIKIVMLVGTLAISSIFAACSENAIVDPMENNSTELSLNDISATVNNSTYDVPALEVAKGLQFMREEEKLARDVYKEMYAKYSLRPFLNISKSEQVHMNAIKTLLVKYNIEDPVSIDKPGVFNNKVLQELYNTLIKNGSVSEIEALKVGAAIEEIDIVDLDKHIKELVNNEDIKFVYNNLKRASGFHLKAYVTNLKSRGIVYTPLYLDVATYNNLIK